MRKVLPLLAVVLGVLTTTFMIRLKINTYYGAEDLVTYQSSSFDINPFTAQSKKSSDTNIRIEDWSKSQDLSTEITFNKDVVVNGKKLNAGKYIFYTIPNQDQWLVVFNKDDNQWGAVRYGVKIDLLQSDIKIKQMPEPVEIMNIEAIDTPDNLGIILKWDNIAIMVPKDGEDV